MMSAHPSDFFGQPSACAIGFHIATTTGDSTTGSPAGASGAVCPGRESQRSFSSAT
jgi:hypothetical protein